MNYADQLEIITKKYDKGASIEKLYTIGDEWFRVIKNDKGVVVSSNHFHCKNCDRVTCIEKTVRDFLT